MSLINKNINLLVAFSALMKEKSVSRAAQNLQITQSAMSKKLEQLRIMFDNPIFLRTKHGLEPTDFALSIEAKVESLLSISDDIFSMDRAFSPETFSRDVVIGMPSIISADLMVQIVSLVEKIAPMVKIHQREVGSADVETLLSKGKIDLAITYQRQLPEGMKTSLLLQDKIVCVADAKHPILKHKRIPIKQYLAGSHIALVYTDLNKLLGDALLKEQGYSTRNIAASTTDALSALAMIKGTERLFAINEKFANRYAKIFDLDYRPMPTFAPMISVNMVWSPTVHDSHWHRWLRSLFKNHLLEIG